MKIYIVYEEYEGYKHVLLSYKDNDQVDWSEDAAINLRNEWDRMHGYLGAKYYIKEVDL